MSATALSSNSIAYTKPSLAERLAILPKTQRERILKSFSEDELEEFYYNWKTWARGNQLPPSGDWRSWLLLAGRGFGKTRVGAEWVRAQVAAGCRRIAIVAPTAADARDVMIEGESGLLSIGVPGKRPYYEPSKRRVTWPNGAIATAYSADEPACGGRNTMRRGAMK